jgi:SanA protein
LRRVFLFLVVAVPLVVGFVAGANWWILHRTHSRIFTSAEAVPANDVAIVLGTSPMIQGRWVNLFFVGRMDTAAALYHAGKVKHLLVSGDNSRRTYDEPTAMRDALVERGVPVEAVTLDYAGFRTLDTMARAQAVFGLRRCTVVTDDFHMARSIYLAQAHGLEAVGCTSTPVSWQWSQKTRLREIASRTVAWLDVSLFHTRPKFYGPPVEIRIADSPAAP